MSLGTIILKLDILANNPVSHTVTVAVGSVVGLEWFFYFRCRHNIAYSFT